MFFYGPDGKQRNVVFCLNRLYKNFMIEKAHKKLIEKINLYVTAVPKMSI